MLILPPEWEKLWRDTDPFEQIFSLQGQEFRNMDGRRTLRFELMGQRCFVKMYSGLGWKKIINNFLRMQSLPVTTARNEWLAIDRLRKLNVETMTAVAYGERGFSPATRKSFLVTEELEHTESLEDFCRDWPTQPPPPLLKRALIKRVAQISRRLHQSGLNHRDYYLCHFLLDISNGRDQVDPDNLHLYLIDLHRVQMRRRLPYRWRLKDLAGLYFSSLDIGLTARDYCRFISCYTDRPLRQALRHDARLWRHIKRRGEKLQRRFQRKFQT